MTAIFQITVNELTGPIAFPANLDNLALVMGCSGASTGLSAFYLSAESATAALGAGYDAVDTLCQLIEQRTTSGAAARKFPGCMYTVPASTPGSYGTIDISAVTGTCVPANAATVPTGTFGAQVIIDTGGTVGTTGIKYRVALDYQYGAPNYGPQTALGTAYTITIPSSGVAFDLNPPSAQITALIAAAVEARTDTLAHLADIVSHNSADTSAAQIALAASSAPTTGAQAWAVMNLCRAALASHESNITVHDGPDGVNVVSHAAATNIPSGVGLYTEYRADYNAHLGIALAADTDGLLVATATTVGVQTYLTADLDAAGIALIATYARKVSFTTSGVTPADAPATATIVGTDYLGAAQTEIVNVPQTATTAFSAGAYKTIISITYSAGQGTAALVAIGIGKGVHLTADATNVLTATTPTNGTLEAGDLWNVRTLAGAPSTSAVDAAFLAIKASPVDVGLMFFDFPCDAAMAAHITTGLNQLALVGKLPTAIVKTRIRDFETAETEQAWADDIAADFLNFDDSRIYVGARYGFVTDARTGNVYLRSTLQQFAADAVRVSRSTWPGTPNDAPSGESNVILINTAGTLIGHDEGPGGAVTGLSDPDLGNRFGCEQRLPIPAIREAVFNVSPWVFYSAGEKIQTLMMRRVANAMKRDAVLAGVTNLGGKLMYIPADPSVPGSRPTLTDASRLAIQGSIFEPLSIEFADDIQNADDADPDTGLVQVNPVFTLNAGGFATISIVLAPLGYGYIRAEVMTLAVQQ